VSSEHASIGTSGTKQLGTVVSSQTHMDEVLPEDMHNSLQVPTEQTNDAEKDEKSWLLEEFKISGHERILLQ